MFRDCDEIANGHSGCDWRQIFELLSPTTLQGVWKTGRSSFQPWKKVIRVRKRDWQSYGLGLEFQAAVPCFVVFFSVFFYIFFNGIFRKNEVAYYIHCNYSFTQI